MISRRAFGKLGVGSLFAAHMSLYKGALGAVLSALPGGEPALRRPGRRAQGSYWGAGPEQIDLLSGNLNVSLPMLTLQSRGLTENLNYSYNSQLWHVAPSGRVVGPDQLDGGSGYGSGWSLKLGAIRPTSMNGETIGYVFSDTFGTEYRLSPQGAVFKSLGGKVLTWTPQQRRLYFVSGKFWQFDSISADDSDKGTLYPTLAQDRNGNQILLRYLPAVGASAINTSGRLESIRDARATGSGASRASIKFVYDASVQPRLQFISDLVGAESAAVSFATRRLVSPFGSDSDRINTAFQLSSAGLVDFGYNSFGELASAQLGDAEYHWDYGEARTPNDGAVRGVVSRTMQSGALAKAVAFTFDRQLDSSDPAQTGVVTHTNSSGASRTWVFGRPVESEEYGLLTTLTEKDDAGRVSSVKCRGWAMGAGGSAFVQTETEAIDPGTSASVTMRKEFSRDQYDNVTEVRRYSLDGNSQPKIIRKTYVNDDSYTAAHILNLRSKTEIFDSSSSALVEHHQFDSTDVVQRFGLQEWVAPQGPRGNVTESYTNNSYYRYQRDSTGRIASKSEGRGVSVIYVPEEGSNNTRLSAIVPNGDDTQGVSVTRTGNDVEVVSPNQQRQKTTLDAKGRTVRSESPDGVVRTFTYDDADPMVRTSVQGNRVKVSRKDALGRLTHVEIRDQSGTVARKEQYTYAEAGFAALGKMQGKTMTSSESEAPKTHALTYNSIGKVISRQMPGYSSSHNFEHAGNATTVTSPAGVKKTYVRDADGLVQKVIMPGAGGRGEHQTTYERNKYGQVTNVRITVPKGTQSRKFSFNESGQLVRTEQPEFGKKTRTYGSDGTLSSVTDAKGQTIKYTRDVLKRTTLIRKFNGAGEEQTAQNVQFHFDSNPLDSGYSKNTVGRLAAVQWGDATSYPGEFAEMYSYSPSGRLMGRRLRITSGAHSVDLDLVMTYNEQGKLSAVVYPQGGPAYSYTYDSLNRVASIVGTSGAIVDGVVYTSGGRLSSFQRKLPDHKEPVTESRTFNKDNRIQRITVSQGSAGKTISDLEYGYSQELNKISMETDHVAGETTAYMYDEAGRLAAAESNTWGFQYQYDDFNNRVSQQVTKGSGFSAADVFDPATNHSVQDDVHYDANGNIVALPDLRLSYDVQNHLSQVTHSVNGTERYIYDPMALRVWRQRPDGSEEVFCYNGGQKLLATYLLSRATSGELAITLMQANTYFRRSLIATDEESVITDRRGTTRARVSKKGQITTHQYYPYGESIQGGEGGSFSSYQRDSISGLDYAQNRYYSSKLGRFITPDPQQASAQAERPLSWNRYNFVSNDPINRRDPNGLSDCSTRPPATPDNASPHQYVFENAVNNADGSYQLTYHDAAGDEMIIGFNADSSVNEIESVEDGGTVTQDVDESQFMAEVDSSISELQQCIATNATASSNYDAWATKLTAFGTAANILLFQEMGLPFKKATQVAAGIAAGDATVIQWGANYMTRSNQGMQNEISNLNNWKSFFNTGGFGCNPNQ